MSCHELRMGEALIHICRPNGGWKPVEHRRKKRFWCFNCRKHLLHTRMMFDPGPESYYEPWFKWNCENCHEEHVLFPGWEWQERE